MQNSKFQIYHIERESYMYEVLNLDEIKNELYSLLVNCETNLMSLIKIWLDTKLLQYIYSTDELIRLIRFVS